MALFAHCASLPPLTVSADHHDYIILFSNILLKRRKISIPIVNVAPFRGKKYATWSAPCMAFQEAAVRKKKSPRRPSSTSDNKKEIHFNGPTIV